MWQAITLCWDGWRASHRSRPGWGSTGHPRRRERVTHVGCSFRGDCFSSSSPSVFPTGRARHRLVHPRLGAFSSRGHHDQGHCLEPRRAPQAGLRMVQKKPPPTAHCAREALAALLPPLRWARNLLLFSSFVAPPTAHSCMGRQQ